MSIELLEAPPKRRATAGRTVVWIDNNVSKFDTLIHSLERALECTIVRLTSPAEGLEYVYGLNDKAIVFLDYVMGASGGMSILGRLLSRGRSDEVYICSGYSYNTRIADDIAARVGEDRRVGFIAKEWLPFAEDADGVKEFAELLLRGEFLTFGRGDRGNLSEDIEGILEREPFPTWDTFLSLDIAGRLAILTDAAQRTAAQRSKLWSEGYVGALFCGNWDRPSRLFRRYDDLPSEGELLRIGHETGGAPFMFSYSPSIDDLSSGCRPPTLLADYPYVELSLAGENKELHLDTGNALSLFAYEWFLERGAITPTIAPRWHSAGDLELMGNLVRFGSVICSDASGASVLAREVTGFAVINWIHCRLAVECPMSCNFAQPYPVSGYKLCVRRHALLGRSFVRELGARLSVDPDTLAISFIGREL